MMRLAFTKCVMSLTCCSSKEGFDETGFHKMCNITHSLLVMGKDVMTLPSQNVQCHSLPVGHWNRCDEIVLHNMCNVTHLLLVLGKDVPFTNCTMSLTSCWS